ncbi:MAG: DUF3786 domain-containing protein [Faecousia sp.]
MRERKNNYAHMLEAARLHYLDYDPKVLAARPGVEERDACLATLFLGTETRIHRDTGLVTCRVGDTFRPANFCEGLSVYDWLCDRKPDATSSGEFCPVGSLPGVYVGGGGLSMSGGSLPAKIDKAPDRFRAACVAMGGTELPLGDLGFRLNVFPDLPMVLKFYHGDEDFPPSLTLLWDKNTLRFVRFETVYYIAGCLLDRLSLRMEAIPRNGTL